MNGKDRLLRQSVGGTEIDERLSIVAGEARHRHIWAAGQRCAAEPHRAIGILRNSSNSIVVQAVGRSEGCERGPGTIFGRLLAAFSPAFEPRYGSRGTPKPH